jgi:hypothetical protein
MIPLSSEILLFLSLAGVSVEPQSGLSGSECTVLSRSERTWTVHFFGAAYYLVRGRDPAHAGRTDLRTIEKLLAMEVGPFVRYRLGLPPEGFLPNIFSLAPGFDYRNEGCGMELVWEEGGQAHGVIVEDRNDVDSLHTYHSQYLRHPLRTILNSYLLDSPGIFTEVALGSPRPFRLPDRTDDWLAGAYPEHHAARQCVFYNHLDAGGIRISVGNGGFRIDRRHAVSTRYTECEFWSPSLEVLQVHLAWDCHPWWCRTLSPDRRLHVPNAHRLAPGFTMEPLEANRTNKRPMKLLREGSLQAVVPNAVDAMELSQLLTIGLDMLEISILDFEGWPALGMRS